MNTILDTSRREFLRTQGAVMAAGAALVITGRLAAAEGKKHEGKEHGEEEEEVSPAEDLMREHGVLKRVLLIYREAIRRIGAREDCPPEAIKSAAGIIHDFIEDYHEKLEEDFLFPRFEKVGKLTTLVCTLREQHEGGRKVTEMMLGLANQRALKEPSDRDRLVNLMTQFVRMYEPHEAREDTVLFPAFRKLVSKHEYDSLGEDFEKKEHALFGEDGFESMVAKVAAIENSLGIADLCQFTPKV